MVTRVRSTFKIHLKFMRWKSCACHLSLSDWIVKQEWTCPILRAILFLFCFHGTYLHSLSIFLSLFITFGSASFFSVNGTLKKVLGWINDWITVATSWLVCRWKTLWIISSVNGKWMGSFVYMKCKHKVLYTHFRIRLLMTKVALDTHSRSSLWSLW